MKPSEAIREIASRRAVDMGNGEKVFNVHPEDILEWLDTHAGSGEVERIADSNESFLIGYAAGKRHAGGVPSAVEVTVEEWEALEWCVSRAPSSNREQASEALRKLNARAAISKSETTQPATGDGTGEDAQVREFSGIVFIDGCATWDNDTKGAWKDNMRDAFRFARELGARSERERLAATGEDYEARYKQSVPRLLTEVAELKEKLAAAEADSERWAKETLELQELVERNAERAEKAEARVAELESLRVAVTVHVAGVRAGSKGTAAEEDLAPLLGLLDAELEKVKP